MTGDDDLIPNDHDGIEDEWAYDDGCACAWCRDERGRRLSWLMFGWMLHA